MNIKDVVLDTVTNFVNHDNLFTALDVSNVVKKKLPYAKHSDVKKEIKEIYDIFEENNYTKTLIEVTLKDGTKTNAFLYHPISDTWDLENKYTNRSALAPVIQPLASTQNSQSDNSEKDEETSALWGNIFNSSNPSLFPRY